MEIDVVTKADLEQFRKDLLEDLKELFQEKAAVSRSKWVKGKYVRELLGNSYGTMQNLRTTGKITYTKIGGTYYYLRVEIEKLFNENLEKSWG